MAKRAKTIDLLRVVDLLQEHITPALCRTVFGAVRTTERQRVWTLEALIRFWTAVVLRAPKALVDLRLELHLVGGHQQVADRARGPNSWPAPRPDGLLVRELPRCHGFTGLRAQLLLFHLLAPDGK
jgi:hypothetical protein